MKQILLTLILVIVCNVSYANIASKEYVDSIIATIQAPSVQDIQINGTSIVNNSIANIPYPNREAAYAGVVKVHSSVTGLDLRASDGIINLVSADDYALENRTQKWSPRYGAVTSGNLDKAIMEGLGNNSLTWTDTYKANARTTIGAQEVISDLDDIRSGAEAGSTAVQPNTLATVATTGSYNDLSNKPTLVTLVPTRPDDCIGRKCSLIYDDTETSSSGFKWELIRQQ